MLQLIILAQLRDDADPEPITNFLARELPTRVPSVRRCEIRRDLGLTKHLGNNATFCWIVDFDDQDGWQQYRDSEAHDEFARMIKESSVSYLATQTTVASA